jgi:TonB family protein
LTRKPRELEASGFGDPDNTPLQNSRREGATVQGIFDATSEAGSGSSRRSREIITGTGFGDNVATAGANGVRSTGDSRGLVREGEFGDIRPAANAFEPRPQAARPALHAAEIISKPKPAYTKEARELGLEGEVVIEVLFTASGDIRILRLIRGLGHGLDEAAVKAAEQIRFKPAERDGKPIDSRSIVQIIFRLT